MSTAAVIVSWDDATATLRAVESLLGQTTPPDEIVVIDNHPEHPAASDAEIEASSNVVASAGNDGFAGGAARGIAATDADWILLLNPDAVAAPDCVERLRAAARAFPHAGLVGAQILLPDGTTNAGDNPVHLTGITWSGRYGEPLEAAPPRMVASVSGAAMLVNRAAYDAIGGMNERFFLYHEDVELAWRMRLAGWDVVFQPAAHVTHDYAFDKGAQKWFYLERNRAWTVLTCYSRRALLVLAPLLLATEAAVALRARRERWWPQKRRAWRAAWEDREHLRRRRSEVQGTRVVGDAEIVRLLVARIDTPLARDAAAQRAGRLLDAYRALLLRLL